MNVGGQTFIAKSGAGLQLLQLICRAKACVKGVFVSQTPVALKVGGGGARVAPPQSALVRLLCEKPGRFSILVMLLPSLLLRLLLLGVR